MDVLTCKQLAQEANIQHRFYDLIIGFDCKILISKAISNYRHQTKVQIAICLLLNVVENKVSQNGNTPITSQCHKITVRVLQLLFYISDQLLEADFGSEKQRYVHILATGSKTPYWRRQLE